MSCLTQAAKNTDLPEKGFNLLERVSEFFFFYLFLSLPSGF